MTRRWMLIGVLLGSVGPAMAATVNLAWDPNAESDLAGYAVYRAIGPCAAPGAFAKVAGVGLQTTAMIAGMGDGEYCFAVTAYDTALNESIQSNRVGVTVNMDPPQPPANLRSVSVTP